MTQKRLTSLVGAIALVAVFAAAASATTVTFDEAGIVEGQILDNEFNTTQFSFLTIEINNLDRGPGGGTGFDPDVDFGVAFDSQDPTGGDNDLLSPATGPGNLPDVELGHVLIIQEHGTDSNNNGIFDSGDTGWTAGNGNTGPDDEGSRPAGTITLNFGSLLSGAFGFGFDLLDVEGAPEFPSGFAATFYNSGTQIQQTNFADLTGVNGITWGNNSLNRIAPDLFASAQDFDQVVISLGGSGAIDNLVFESVAVPEPATILLLGTGLAGLAAYRRRRAA